MRPYIIKSVMVLCLLLFSNCEKETVHNIDVEAEIMAEMAERNIPSVAACIIKGDEIVWEKYFGFADLEKAYLQHGETIYPMMSISKLVLSTAIMQLWEQGLIDLNEDINTYLPFEVRNPKFPDSKISSQMLLNHTSGLAWPEEEDRIPDFYHFYPDSEVPLLRDWIPEYIIPGRQQYNDNVWKNFKPGENELYSNIGTALLALVLEEITQKDFRDYSQENILEPLKMHNSSYRLNGFEREKLATPYHLNNHPFEPYILRAYPVGSLHSNLRDFSHFVIAIMNQGKYQGKQILKPETMEKMFEIQNPESGISNLWWHSYGGVIGHDGGGTGYSMRSEMFINKNIGLIILSNKVNSSVRSGGRIHELVRFQCNMY